MGPERSARISVVESDWSVMYATSSVGSRVVIGTSTAPIFITAKAASIHSGRLRSQSATLSPGRMPRAISPLAARSTPAARSANAGAPPLKPAPLARAPAPRRPLGQRAQGLLLEPVTPFRRRHQQDPFV